MRTLDAILILGTVACWCVTGPMIAKNWRDVRKHRKPDEDWRLKEAGLKQWDYSDCTKEPKWCEACDQPARYGLLSTYDRLVADSGMLIAVTALCAATVCLT